MRFKELNTEEGELPIQKPNNVSDQQWQKAVDLYKVAKRKGDRYPALTVAQAALETGWFRSPSGRFNYFGQKASKSQEGTVKTTQEMANDQAYVTKAKFRDYNSLESAIDDRLKKWGEKYKDAPTIDAAIGSIWQYDPETGKGKGYATDVQYGSKIKSILNSLGVSSDSRGSTKETNTPARSDVYRQAERPEAVVENTQTIIDERINLYTPPELTTFVDESEVTTAPSKQEEPEKKEPKATQKAKQELEKKKAEERFLSDILSGGVRAEVEQEQPAPEAQQPVQPFGSFIIPKAQELGIFQDGGITVDELKNSPINKGYEMSKEGRQFLDYWMSSARFKNKLKENILEADSLKRDPRYQGFIDEYLFDIDEDTERVREEAIEALNETAVYGNDISSKDKEKLSRAFQELYGETDGVREVREYLAYGLHKPEGDAIWLNRRENGTPIHELTHSTDLDVLMSKISPRSKIHNEVVETFKQRYPDRENLDLSLGGLGGPNVGGRVRPYGILLPRYETVANKEDIENVLDSLSKRDGKKYDIGGLRYIDSSREVYPRIMSIREKANIKPDEVIDEQRMEEIYNLTKENEELYRYYSKDQVKEMLNKFAGIDNDQSNLNVAKKGGTVKFPDGGTAPKQPEDPEYTLQFPYTNLQAPYLYPPKTQQRQVQEAFLNWYKDPATTQRLQEVHGLSPEETEQYLTRGVEGVIKEGTPGARDAKAQFYTGSGDIVTTDLSDIPLNVHEITHRSELDERLAGPLLDILGKPSGVFRKVKNYLSEPTEAYGNFAEFRGRLGVQPGERIDEAKFDKLVKEKGLTEENFYRAFDKEKIIKALNTVAFTDRLRSNNATQVAQAGGQVTSPFQTVPQGVSLEEVLSNTTMAPDRNIGEPSRQPETSTQDSTKLRKISLQQPPNLKLTEEQKQELLSEGAINLEVIEEEDLKNLSKEDKKVLQRKLIQEGALREKLEIPRSKEEIKNMQQLLIDQGYDLGSYGADGIAGRLTKQALNKYNEEASAIDGIVGKRTLTALREYRETIDKLQPIVDSLKKEASLAGKALNTIPIAARQFVYDTFGGEGDITEADLNEGEYDALRQAVAYSLNNNVKKNGINVINYDVWRKIGSGGDDVRSDDMNIFNPASSLQKTLGQAAINIDQEGNIYVIDRYNFNDAGDEKNRNNNSLTTTSGLLPLQASTSASNLLYRVARNFKTLTGKSEGGSKSIIYAGNVKDYGI